MSISMRWIAAVLCVLVAGCQDEPVRSSSGGSPSLMRSASAQSSVAPRTAAQSSVVNFELATFVTPRNFPMGLFDPSMMNEYYSRTAQIGSYVGYMANWFDADNQDLEGWWKRNILDSRARGFKYIMQLNLLSRDAGSVGTPPSVSGNSFTDPAVRAAYKQRVLDVASHKPEVLLVAVELNNLLFHDNKREYDAFKAFAPELYQAVKAAHPQVTVSVSFQLDHLRLRNEYGQLGGFENSLDLYSFSSYPTVFGMGDVDGIPGGAAYYASVRDHLPPNARVAMAESGWASRGRSNAQQQVVYYQRLPQLMSGLKPEFVLVSYLHDFPVPAGVDDNTLQFSSMGLFNPDGSAKPAMDIVRGYYQ